MTSLDGVVSSDSHGDINSLFLDVRKVEIVVMGNSSKELSGVTAGQVEVVFLKVRSHDQLGVFKSNGTRLDEVSSVIEEEDLSFNDSVSAVLGSSVHLEGLDEEFNSFSESLDTVDGDFDAGTSGLSSFVNGLLDEGIDVQDGDFNGLLVVLDVVLDSFRVPETGGDFEEVSNGVTDGFTITTLHGIVDGDQSTDDDISMSAKSEGG